MAAINCLTVHGDDLMTQGNTEEFNSKITGDAYS